MIVAMIAASIWYFLYPSPTLTSSDAGKAWKKTKNLYCFKIMVIPFFAKPLCQLLTSAWKEADNHGQFRLCLHLAYHTDAWPLPCLLAPRKRFFSLQFNFQHFLPEQPCQDVLTSCEKPSQNWKHFWRCSQPFPSSQVFDNGDIRQAESLLSVLTDLFSL